MAKWKKVQKMLLLMLTIVASGLFVFLYIENLTPVEKPQQQIQSTLQEWGVEQSNLNSIALEEDKSIYAEQPDTQIYDVYLSVFPTKESDGTMIDFSAFGLHQSRGHDYNPVLNCNVQILEEGKTLDPLTGIDTKNATVRVRGNSSRGDTFKSYKIKLDEEAEPFYGQTNLNINKHSEDITKIATKLETDLLIEADDILSYQTYFMRVWIRDTSLPKEQQKFKYYGLFTEIEQPNKTYLEKRGLSSSASMYKARDFSFQLSDVLKNVNDPQYNEADFETVLTIREGKNHDHLLEMLHAVNDMEQDFEEVFQTYFNEDNYLTWLAFNLLMGNNDIINHNFILYNPDNSNTWYFVPWDFDGTLRFGEYESSLMKLPPSLKGVQKLNQSVLHRRYLRMDGSIEKIQDKMNELLEEVVTKERVTELVQDYIPVLEKTVVLEPDLGLLDMTPPELFVYLENLYDGILSNSEAFEVSMEYPMPMYVSQPEQNDDGTVKFSWQASYSYQGSPITYNLQLYEDYNMQKLVLEEKNIVNTSYECRQTLNPGTYYLKVTAVDSDGDEQLSMERFETMLTEVKGYNVNGLLEVIIQ